MLKIIKLFCFAFLVLGLENASAQLSKSPYTTQGIGEIQGKGIVAHESMGGVGVAFGRPFFINSLNPALLPLNTITSFDIATYGERRDLSRDTLFQTNTTLDFGYLVFAFPVIRGRNTISFGLRPYSSVDYSFVSKQGVVGSPTEANVSVMGTGGINDAYFATGARFFKNLYVGFRASYYFGSIVDETMIEPFVINEQDTLLVSTIKTNYYRRTSYSSGGLGIGAVYGGKINKNLAFSIGGTYDLQTNLSGKRLETLQQRSLGDEILSLDTLLFNNERSITLPAKYAFGISVENGFKWAAAVDLTMQDWSQFSNYSGETENMKNSYNVAAGIEFIPDYSSVTSYFKRALYRVGGYYEATPYSKNNVQVNEFGINFGAGLPVRDGSLLNLMFGYGQRGFDGEGLIRESFYKFGLGITFNDSGWFQRRKYN